jgi:hypothetical protein
MADSTAETAERAALAKDTTGERGESFDASDLTAETGVGAAASGRNAGSATESGAFILLLAALPTGVFEARFVLLLAARSDGVASAGLMASRAGVAPVDLSAMDGSPMGGSESF